jgi:acetoacetyl-CoA synthetase
MPEADTPAPIWAPTPADLDASNITHFTRWLIEQRGIKTTGDYAAVWRWSVDHLEAFWAAVWDYFEIQSPTPYQNVLSGTAMPDFRWFEGARVSYVEQLFRGRTEDSIAIIDVQESSEPGAGPRSRCITWGQLRSEVATLAATMRELGVQHGDTVVGYVPNAAEAVVAFLATASLGAMWSGCGQDYAASAAADRFSQLDPVLMVAADGYRYGGRRFDKRNAVRELRDRLPTLRATLMFDRVGLDVQHDTQLLAWPETSGTQELSCEYVSFEHPLWVLFSSGTTGRPKGIVHSTGGVLLEHLKAMSLNLDLGESDTFFWYTSPSWMVWNYLISGMLVGARIVCYDGSPGYPSLDTVWALAAEHRVTLLGTSPAHLRASADAGLEPGTDHDLSPLRSLGSSGSALPKESYFWVAEQVGARVRVNSTSGGTDIVSAFASGAGTVPVWPGELSVPCLGVALDAWDPKGNPVRDSVGELVVTKPMPSMPVSFWNDPDGSRYREAYFDMYPGVWRHGDWITITARGSMVIHGRSDSTLNRNGIRMGSADIYQAVEVLDEVAEALVIGVEKADGGYWMPMFVVLNAGLALDDALTARIRTAVREGASPKHVPDEVIAVPGIPHTRTGKKLEVPIKRLLQGARPEDVLDPQAVDEPSLLDWFATFGQAESKARS